MIKSGFCPKCNSENLDYDTVNLYEGGLDYPYVCKDCGFEGLECYNIEFTHHENLNGVEVGQNE